MGLDSSIEASSLAKEYLADKQAFNRRYTNKYLTISGQIAQFYTNKYKENIIILMDSEKRYGIKCILNSSSKQLTKPLKQGEQIKINGKFDGFDEFIVLRGCLILKD